MSSGSLKDVAKAITTSISTPTYPLPDDLLVVIQAYLDKHEHIDDPDSQRLQDELLAIHSKDVLDKPSRYAFFVALLLTLRPAIKGTKRLLQWWDLLLQPCLAALSEEKGLASVSRLVLLDILCYDADDESENDFAATSSVFAQKLLLVWLQHVEAASAEADPSASFIEKQIKLVLLEFGRRRPKDFLTVIDAEFVMTRHRTQTLSILCEFVRYQPPHLHQLLQTPLFNNLIKCLTIDTSTTVVSLAMTALIMFLPHIPQSMAAHLPSLFLIYGRILFWEKERILSPVVSDDHVDSETSEDANGTKSEKKWEKLYFSFESADSTVPELLHYFTFLYGLYPINFMSYIRKPQRYLRHANFPGADEIEIEPIEIRQRSEQFRQLHLLHPNFYTMTIDSELTDPNRFMKSEAADVVADCMALCGPLYPESNTLPRPAISAKLNDIPELQDDDDDDDVPEQPLLDKDDDATLSVASAHSSRHNSWRNTQSTAVISPDSSRAPSRLLRKASQTSQSVLGSPGLRPQQDSPTLPPQAMLLNVQTPLQDMLSSQKSLKDNLQQSLPNESDHSIPQQDSSTLQVDSYLQSLAQPIPRSPSLKPTVGNDPKNNLANLRREIMLLKNDLNFERYLKQQHLSHIGQLRRLHVKEATVEAETQNLINANKSLKTKLEDARRSELQIKKESEKSRTHSKKWEADLSAKLRAIREEQKKWTGEGEMLKKQLEGSREDCRKLRQLVVDSEAKELLSQQKMQSIELDLEELERLRTEVAKLNATLRSYEAKEEEREKARENEEAAYTAVQTLQMQLVSRDDEVDRIRIDYENKICDLREKINEAYESKRAKHPESLQDLLDGALASLRTRYMDLQKSHNKLLKKYAELEKQILLTDGGGENFDEPLLASRARLEDEGGYRSARSGSPMYRGLTTPDTGDSGRPSDVSSPASGYSGGTNNNRPTRLNLPSGSETAPRSQGSSGGSTTPNTIRPLGFDGFTSPFVQTHREAAAAAAASEGEAKVERRGTGMRYYGRGGIQNSGSKREKKDGEKKKGSGIRGIRGFV